MEKLLQTVHICLPQGKHKVLTMSYDDGNVADLRLVEIFNKNGIKGSFHINAGLDNYVMKLSDDEFRKLYSGHEVSAHSYTHPTIARSPKEQIVQQVIFDRQGLERKCGYPVRGLSYPNGSVSDEVVSVLESCGVEYARTVESTKWFSFPDNYLRWNPTCHHSDNLIERGKEFLDLHKTQYLFMMYVWGHSYEFDRENNWELMEEFCEMMGGKSDIWYATNIEIVDYMNAAKSLKYTIDLDMVYNPSATDVWLDVGGNVHCLKAGEFTKIEK